MKSRFLDDSGWMHFPESIWAEGEDLGKSRAEAAAKEGYSDRWEESAKAQGYESETAHITGATGELIARYYLDQLGISYRWTKLKSSTYQREPDFWLEDESLDVKTRPVHRPDYLLNVRNVSLSKAKLFFLVRLRSRNKATFWIEYREAVKLWITDVPKGADEIHRYYLFPGHKVEWMFEGEGMDGIDDFKKELWKRGQEINRLRGLYRELLEVKEHGDHRIARLEAENALLKSKEGE